MRSIVFDSGPVISLTVNNLLWILKPLKTIYKGDFIITKSVQRELVSHPLETKKFKLEALQVMKQIKDNIITVFDDSKCQDLLMKLLTLANNTFSAKSRNIQIVHYAEISAVATALHLKSDAVVMDERTTRLLIEDPKKLHNILERKLHTRVYINNENLEKFREYTKGLKILRSLEIALIAYEKSILDNLLPDIKDAKKTLLDSIAWGLKLNGCSVGENEIKEIVKIEKKFK